MSEDFVVSPAFFESGVTFQEFVQHAEENKNHFEALYLQTQVPERQSAKLQSLGRKAPNWLLICEDWCIDCVAFGPAAAKLAQAAKATLKVFTREENPALAERYKHHNKIKTPTLVFFDPSFNEVGRWIERPKTAQKYANALGRENAKKAKEISTRTGREYDTVVKELKTKFKQKLFTAYLELKYTADAIEEMIHALETAPTK